MMMNWYTFMSFANAYEIIFERITKELIIQEALKKNELSFKKDLAALKIYRGIKIPG